MKKIALFMALAALAIAVPAAWAGSNGGNEEAAMPPNVYCFNGETAAAPVTISFDGHDIPLFQSSLESILGKKQSVTLLFGYQKGTTDLLLGYAEDSEFFADNPAPTVYTLARGACAAPMAVQPDRSFWLCYSSYQTDPAVYSRATAEALLKEGMWVPYAVKSPVSKTGIGNGVYLTCSIPAGMSPTGAAVSTGGGEAYNAPYASVPVANRLDEAMLVG
ncbi:MAG TPA: hypothetical protein VFW52_03490 [Candidatus Saccharimonadales bacterium]|nr:hypothetical protein [Candidatus Saccharimonadales bacterium]